MRIVHMNTTTHGGAARAMLRLHHGLRAAGVDSLCLTAEGVLGLDGPQPPQRGPLARRLLPRLDKLPLRLYPQRSPAEFNLQWVPGGILKALEILRPDVVHLHWICRSLVRIEDLPRIRQPIIWTLHDCWAFTGGCHTPLGCRRFAEGCGQCPQLGSSSRLDLSRWVWRRKAKAWRNAPMTLVASSRWLADLAAQSPLLRDKSRRVIPLGLDTQTFHPLDHATAREALGLPADKKLVLFGALYPFLDRNKGFHHLGPALTEARRALPTDSVELVVFGQPPVSPPDLGLPVRSLGMVHDDLTLRLLYAAADLTVAPSAMEAFGQVGAESLACGTPVVAFQGTGLADVVDHGKNGYLAAHGDALDLGAGIAFILGHPEPQSLRQAARAKAESSFSLPGMCAAYAELYQNALLAARNEP